ncbi:hypothetical protein [Microbacterium foliorum]|uniref:hypothetical protein n=1 Tax=Microbacterium foliorum TaxID=104336 RepID=UPI003735A642
MSDTYGTTSLSGSDAHHEQDSGKAEAAKNEAAGLADTAGTQAKDVIGTAKAEAASVVGEAKTQAKDLYAQTTRELKEQAHTQQQRLAGGLRSVSDELGSMAANSEGSGVASDLVQQVAGRLSGAASWLGDRDPASVLTEVKRYARREPGTFILGAAIVGVAVGRLTRALASNSSEVANCRRASPQSGRSAFLRGTHARATRPQRRSGRTSTRPAASASMPMQNRGTANPTGPTVDDRSACGRRKLVHAVPVRLVGLRGGIGRRVRGSGRPRFGRRIVRLVDLDSLVSLVESRQMVERLLDVVWVAHADRLRHR